MTLFDLITPLSGHHPHFHHHPYPYHHHLPHHLRGIDDFIPRRTIDPLEKISAILDEVPRMIVGDVFDDRPYVRRPVISPLSIDPLLRITPLVRERPQTDRLHQRAEKILDEISHKDDNKKNSAKVSNVFQEKPKELLGGEDDFGGLLRGVRDGNVSGVSYQSSSITKDGKTITVSKTSKLEPDGVIRTKVNQKVKDEKGHVDSKTWRNKVDLRKAIYAEEPEQGRIGIKRRSSGTEGELHKSIEKPILKKGKSADLNRKNSATFEEKKKIQAEAEKELLGVLDRLSA